MRKVTAILMTVLMSVLTLTGCGGQSDSRQSDNQSSSQEAVSAENESAAKDQAILVVSFGTSYNDSRDKTIGAIESAIQKAFPEYDVRRAFTSQIIIDKLKERDGLEIDNVTEALDRAVADGVKTLIVQPTHLMDGYEYTDLKDELQKYESKFEKVALGAPLLTDDSDFETVANAIVEDTSSYDDGNTAICFMGHGTEAESNGIYEKMQETMTAGGHNAYYIGTVEAEPSLDDVMAAVGSGNYTRVVLQPLMVVAGDHANNDMAGDEEDSWKSQFESAGYQVECVIRGLGEMEKVQQLYVAHTQAAIDQLEKN